MADKNVTYAGVVLNMCSSNSSNRVYSEEAMKKAVDEYMQRVQRGEAFGTLGRSEDISIDFSRISHKVKGLEIEDGKVKAELEVIGDQMFAPGQTATELIRRGEACAAPRMVVGPNGDVQLLSIDIIRKEEALDEQTPLKEVDNESK